MLDARVPRDWGALRIGLLAVVLRGVCATCDTEALKTIRATMARELRYREHMITKIPPSVRGIASCLAGPKTRPSGRFYCDSMGKRNTHQDKVDNRGSSKDMRVKASRRRSH